MTADGVGGAGADEGGDVAAGQQGGQRRSPDAIQKEIELTRAELAGTIDAIADRISPKRAATRGAQAVRNAVFSGRGPNGAAPAAVIGATPQAAAHVDTQQRTRALEQIAREGGGAQYTGTSEFALSRRLRTDRVLIVVGVAAAVTAAVILWRSRD